ncbi:unnamed protein product [Dracunculus medinensis]|uniref:Telomere length and silencing protein 1 homolog n=1 Tax=Dracunculus medinensis TaxID=318479 RepID=A0A0N4UGG2_DRAME|nr:unnamed protein product [Dracunculus medinensis]
MKRSYLFRKPIDVNNDDDEFLNIRESNRKIIHAKPIKEKYVKKLGSLGSGIQLIEEKSEECRSLSFDERNKLSAKILKAELKGDLDLVKKLKAKLEGSSAENLLQSEKSEILLRTNEKSGLTMPVFKKAKCDDTDHSSEKTKYKLGDVEAKYHSQMELNEMRKEEKYTNASDQLYLFSQSAKAACSSRTEDDWVIDDAMMSQKKKRKFAEKEQKREHEKAIRGRHGKLCAVFLVI